jgi:hypothetical protein
MSQAVALGGECILEETLNDGQWNFNEDLKNIVDIPTLVPRRGILKFKFRSEKTGELRKLSRAALLRIQRDFFRSSEPNGKTRECVIAAMAQLFSFDVRDAKYMVGGLSSSSKVPLAAQLFMR